VDARRRPRRLAGVAAARAPPPGLVRRVTDIAKIEKGLATVGFSADEVAKIAHGNWLRVYEDVFV
jgi:microsomal dipeptidase-like Zn-dependent dipeptidase